MINPSSPIGYGPDSEPTDMHHVDNMHAIDTALQQILGQSRAPEVPNPDGPRTIASLSPPTGSIAGGSCPRGSESSGGSEMALYQRLSYDVNANGTSKQTLWSDAANLAIAAGESGDLGLERDARNIGNSLSNGYYSQDESSKTLAAAAPGTVAAEQIPDGSGAAANALGVSFIQLEKDVAGGANPDAMSSDANLVANLATKSGETGLAAAAHNIQISLGDGTYSQNASLQALMENSAANSDLV